MGVPTVITDLSATAASNSPAGGDSIGTSLDDYLRAGFAFERQLFDTGVIWAGTAGGTANALTLTPSPAITAYKAGQSFIFKSGASPSSSTATVAISGVASPPAIQLGGAALTGGEILANSFYLLTLDTTSTAQLTALSTAAVTAPFTDSTALVKGSSDATKLIRFEVDGNTTGTTRVITPLDENFTMVGLASTQTLTNKSLQDSTTFIIDNSDVTKKAAFECSGITTGTTRTLTVPDASGTIALTNTATTSSQSTPADPTGTTSASQVMMGLAGSITPTASGKVLIIISGSSYNSSGGTINTHQIRYGTGAAPSNAAAATGTAIGAARQTTPSNGGSPVDFSIQAIVSGLTPATAYWIDLGVSTAGSTANVKQISISAVEL